MDYRRFRQQKPDILCFVLSGLGTFHRPQFDVPSAAPGLQLDTGIFVVPAVTDEARVVAVHGLLHRLDRLAEVLLCKGFPLEHQIGRGGQPDDVEAFGDGAVVILRHFHALHTGSPQRDFMLVSTPHTSQPTSSQ